MRITFEEVKTTRIYRWKENGKNRQKTQTFMQTINPFNKNATGATKSWGEIWAEINREADTWLAEQRKSTPVSPAPGEGL